MLSLLPEILSQMRKKIILSTFKWGTFSAILLMLMELVKYYAHLIEYPFQTVSVLVFILIMVGLLYFCIKEVRDKVYGGHIAFARAFATGTLMTLFSALVLFPFLNIQYKYIDPNAVHEMNKRNWNNFRTLQTKDSLTVAEFSDFFRHIETAKKNYESLSTLHTVDSQSFENIDSLLNELLYVTQQKLQGIDTVNLGNVVIIAQKEWMKSSAIMLNNAAQIDTTNLYTPLLQKSIQAIHDSMPNFAPIDFRMESLKNTIPHYNTPVAAALSYTIFTVMLYGLFFSIFVALYLYRKKNIK